MDKLYNKKHKRDDLIDETIEQRKEKRPVTQFTRQWQEIGNYTVSNLTKDLSKYVND